NAIAFMGYEAQLLDEKGRSPARRLLKLDLFPDVALELSLDRVERKSTNMVLSSGKVEGLAMSTATFVTSGRNLIGSMNLGDGRIYQVRTEEDGTIWTLEIDQSRFPKDEPDTLPESPQNSPSNLRAAAFDLAAASDDGATIDVMVLYTPAARIAAG